MNRTNINFFPPWAAIFLLVGMLVLESPARAGYLPLEFLPATPVEGELVQAVMVVGGCDAVDAGVESNFEVVVEENTIRLTVVGITATQCFYPSFRGLLALPDVPTGTYEVELHRRLGHTPHTIEHVASGTLVLGPAPLPEIVNIPATGVEWLALLLALTSSVAVVRYRTA